MNPFESSPEQGKKNPLHNEHLAEGVQPIMASICDWGNAPSELMFAADGIGTKGEDVNYTGDSSEARRKNMLQPDNKTYVISDCTERDKRSSEYFNCTGMALVGTERESGKQISMLTHQDPEKILRGYKESFCRDLSERISEIARRSVEHSIDAVVFGGQIPYMLEYKESIAMLARVCEEILGFEPVVLTGPKMNAPNSHTSVLLDTQNRRLYLIRPAQDGNRTNGSYLPSQLGTERKKWE